MNDFNSINYMLVFVIYICCFVAASFFADTRTHPNFFQCYRGPKTSAPIKITRAKIFGALQKIWLPWDLSMHLRNSLLLVILVLLVGISGMNNRDVHTSAHYVMSNFFSFVIFDIFCASKGSISCSVLKTLQTFQALFAS